MMPYSFTLCCSVGIGILKILELITDLCYFFKASCSKVLDLNKLDKLQSHIILTLCSIVKVFVPSFFMIMVPLLIHLVEEAKSGGPVHYRWMYPIESLFAGQ